MKTNRLFLAALAAITVLFAGCRPEQSELDIESLNTKARISGTIVYDAGVDINSDNAYMVNRIVPAAERTVYVEIPYSEFSNTTANDKNESSKIYECVTDSAGNFTIEVPTTPKGINNVTVRMQEFVTARSEYKKMENNAPVFETKLYRYEWDNGGKTLSLKPGSNSIIDEANQHCTFELVEVDGLDETITFKGTMNAAYETEFRTGAYKKLANTTIVFTAKYTGIKDAIEFGTVTDDQGNYTITLPIENYEEGFESLSVRAKGAGAGYKHFYEVGKSIDLNGAYEKTNVLNGKMLTEIIEGMEYRMPEQFLMFSPNYNNGLTDGVVPSTWPELAAGYTLAGWERYDGFTQTQAIKGQALMATESAFGVGTFGNPKQEALIAIKYPGSDIRGRETGGIKYLYVPTDKSGNFSVEVPVADKQETLPVMFVNEYEDQDMTHYLSDGKSIKIDGKYNATNDVVKELGTEWYEIGKVYYLFSPDAQTDEMEWNGNLAGWRAADADYHNWETAVKITGDVKLPYESAMGVGAYKAADGVLANISVQIGDDYSKTYATLVKGGKIDMTLMVDAPSTVALVSVARIAKEEKAFKHFDINGKESVIAGNYTAAYALAQDKRENWNELGDIYCTFTPNTPAPAQWNEIFADLAGWKEPVAIHTHNFKQKAQITANIQLPVESALGVGEYVPADKVFAKVNVNGISYTVLTNGGNINFTAYIKDANDPNNYANVEAIAKEEKAFRHFTLEQKELTLEGLYSLRHFTAVDKRENWNEIGEVFCNFTPKDAANIDYWNDWFAHLAGWVRLDNCTLDKNITGSIYRAEETSYCKGSYVAQANTLVYANVLGTKYVAITDENGQYTIPVVLNPESSEPNSVAVTPFFADKEVEYTHYLPKGKKEVMNVRYDIYDTFQSKRIQGYTPWNEVGAIYFRAPSKVQDSYAGWINKENEVRHDYKKILTVTGNIKRAIEKPEGNVVKAGWIADNVSRRVDITIGGEEFTTVSASNGSFTLQVNMKEFNDNDLLLVTVVPENGSATEKETFYHYPDNNKTTDRETIYGYYLADNYENVDGTVASGKITLEKSVKMLFQPTDFKGDDTSYAPEGWNAYTWDTTLE